MNKANKELNNVAEANQLFDLYGGLLTEKKRQFMELYYEEDMSLAEIAEEFNISRAAVHDSLKSAEKSLREYEKKLGLLSGYREREITINKIADEMERLLKENPEAETRILEIKRLLETFTE